LLTVFFAKGPHCLWCPKNRWSLPLGAFIALKIGKDELEARKLWPSSKGGSLLKKNKMRKLCTCEIGGAKMKKNMFCRMKKRIFLYSSCLAARVALHFKDDS